MLYGSDQYRCTLTAVLYGAPALLSLTHSCNIHDQDFIYVILMLSTVEHTYDTCPKYSKLGIFCTIAYLYVSDGSCRWQCRRTEKKYSVFLITWSGTTRFMTPRSPLIVTYFWIPLSFQCRTHFYSVWVPSPSFWWIQKIFPMGYRMFARFGYYTSSTVS